MANPIPRDRPLTLEEYFALEQGSSIRHEYVDGEIYAMSGPTRRHNRITMNIGARLWAAVRGGPCRVSQESVKLHVGRVVYYPDVMVACGPEPEDEYVEVAPCLVVEVLSPSTAAIDRREKLREYRSIEPLGIYLIVDQERRLVDHHWRDVDGWRHVTLVESGAITLSCPSLTITLDEIYEGVELPPLDEVLMRVREEAEAYG